MMISPLVDEKKGRGREAPSGSSSSPYLVLLEDDEPAVPLMPLLELPDMSELPVLLEPAPLLPNPPPEDEPAWPAPVFCPWPPLRLARQLLNSSANFL